MNKNIIFRFLAFYNFVILFLILLLLRLLGILDENLIVSIILSFIIAFTNFLIGIVSIIYGLNKKDKSFLLIVFGTIIFRFFTIFLMIIGVVSFLDVRTDYFIFTSFIIYFYYLVVEIFYLKNSLFFVSN
jgi:hypothetical protein